MIHMNRGVHLRKASILGAASVFALSAAGEAYADVTDEIVVTARKREESLQDIPISGVVLGRDIIDDFSLDSARDFITFVPGAFIQSEAGPEFRDDLVVRGSGAEAVESTASATSLNRNGLFIGNGTFFGKTFTRFDLFDLERFEVYRGPQGALFGRNAVGGAVNIVTAKPKFEHEGRVKLGYEVEREGKTVEIVENFPVNEKVAVRLGALWDKREGGFIVADDPLSPLDGDKFDEAFYGGVRAQIRFQPGDDLDINLTAEFSEQKSASFANLLSKPQQIVTMGSAGIGTVTGRDTGLGKFGRRRFARDDSDTDTETANLFAEAEWDRSFGTFHASFHYMNRIADAQDDFDAFRATMEAYPGIVIDANATRTDRFEKFAGEIYLRSNESAPENIKWLIGADSQVYEDYFQQFSPFFTSYPGFNYAALLNMTTVVLGMTVVPLAQGTPTLAAAGMPFTAGWPFISGVTGGTSGVILVPGGAFLEGFLAESQEYYRNLTRRSKSYSVFGNFEYDPIENLTLGVEGRLTYNQLEGKFQSTAYLVGHAYSGGPVSVVNPITGAPLVIATTAAGGGCITTGIQSGAPYTTTSGVGGCGGVPVSTVALPIANIETGLITDPSVREPHQHDLRFTPVGSISYKFAQGDLLYARVGAGFRPEDFATNTDPPTEYDSETVVAYELGYKGQAGLWGGRLVYNANLYYDHHSNYQQVAIAPNEFTGAPAALLTNAGNAWSAGLEGDVRGSWQTWGGTLYTIGSFATSYGELTTGSPALVLAGIGPVASTKGNRFPGTKDYQVALTGGYQAPLPNTDWQWFTNATFQAEGGGYRNAFNTEQSANWEQVNGSLGVRGGGWRAQLFAKNIFNEIYELDRFSSVGEGMITLTQYTYSQPRTWGAEVTINW